jgi:2-polyprenyl-3-methyl-5-hydroxy-6-metoxy-1,4-benzoquinol methylase
MRETTENKFSVEFIISQLRREMWRSSLVQTQQPSPLVQEQKDFRETPGDTPPSPLRLLTSGQTETEALKEQRDRTLDCIALAESRSQVRGQLPGNARRFPYILFRPFQVLILKIFNLLFRDQREVNSNLFAALRNSLALNEQLLGQVELLREQTREDLLGLDREFQLQSHQQTAQLQELQLQSHQQTAQLQELQLQSHQQTAQLQAIQNQISQIDDSLYQNSQELDQKIWNFRSDTQDKIETVSQRVTEIDQRYLRQENYLRSDLVQQKRLLTLFLEEARKRLPEPFTPQELQTFVLEEGQSLDALYVAFEEQFRGTEADIAQRLSVYLPYLESYGIRRGEDLVLDMGCGRGEWLELLKVNGYQAKGIDSNALVIDYCQQRQLLAERGDAIAYLQSLPAESVGGVSGFHIIEHLPFPVLVQFIDQIHRVLRPGGMVIFESPNPSNLIVGSWKFYFDPTHLNPLPSATSQFLVEYAGFTQVKVLNLHPAPDPPFPGDSDLVKRLNEYFYGPQDYAIIGLKPTGSG